MGSKATAISYGELEQHLGYHIRRCHTALIRQFAPFGKQHDLKTQQFSILVLVQENPGITPAALANAIDIKRSLMVKLGDDLASRGLITSKASAEDRRSKHLRITPEGRKFIRQASRSLRADIEPTLTHNLTDKEVDTLLKLLPKIYASR